MSSSFDGVMALLLFDPTALGKNTMAPGGASSSSAERFFSVYKAAEVSNTITPHAVDAGAPVLSTVTKKQAAKRLETWYQEVDTTIAMGEVERIALNHVMHGTADERSNTTSQDHEHRLRQLILQERGLQALHSRARILQNYVSRVKAGTLPRNEPVLRSLMAFCRRLSTTSSLLDCSNSNPHQASPTLSLVQRSERPRSQDCSSDTPSESSMSLSHSCRRQTQVPSSSAETFSGCDTVGPSSDLRAKDAGQQRSREDVSTGLLPGNSGEDNVIVSAMPGKKTKDHERRTIADPLEERDRNMEETMETQEATVTREEAERTDVDSVMLQMSVLLSAMTEAVRVANRTTEKLLVAQSCTPRPGSPRHFVPCPSSSRGGHSS
ncbi:cop9 signalosome complex subunit 6 [Cystoisospora suis]|uniref:Cop9 signalosome complex subunit 6 n=1 Tax=Cystoisospora suis TaxID=483139 RepID=A0A2C6L3V7_9APIC|nr:cop9 signalosome complex subunit 6 [Cystoisospora suis]